MPTTSGSYHENHDGAYPVPFLENLFSTAPQDSFIEIRAIRSGFSFRRSYRRRGDGGIPPVPYLGERNIYFGVLP